jgi:hypothetical protein
MFYWEQLRRSYWIFHDIKDVYGLRVSRLGSSSLVERHEVTAVVRHGRHDMLSVCLFEAPTVAAA